MGRKSLDLSGKTFTNFTVIKKDTTKENDSVNWICECGCGDVFIASSKRIMRTANLSCGCKARVKSSSMEVGQKFGKLTVLSEPFPVGKYFKVDVLCDCGSHVTIDTINILKGLTKSCGCYRTEKHTTHGQSSTDTYKIYHGILQRCNNINDERYGDYGGRGIKVSSSWLESYQQFLSDVGERPSKNHSIERLDTNGNYCKENCKWATASIQAFNQRPSKSNTSGRMGVFWYKSRKKWVVKLTKHGKEYWFGQYSDFADACMAASEGEISLYGFTRDTYHTHEAQT